jgi:anti-sigma factor RsiW
MGDAASNPTDDELAELCALADGTLPAGRRAAVEARVAADPALQELLERQRRSLAATAVLATDVEPPALRAAVEALRPRRVRAGRRRLAGQLAGATAAAAAAAIALVVVLGGPGGPTVAEAAQLASLAPTTATQAPLDVDVEGVAFPDLSQPVGWRPTGVRYDTLDGRRATTVFYDKDGARIAYVIVGGDGLPRPSDAPETVAGGVTYHTLDVDGRNAVTWQRNGHTCVLVGAVPDAELLRLASY